MLGNGKVKYSRKRIEEWIWTDLLEADIRNKFWHVKPGDIVFDIGCDFGSYTLPACADGGYVYAFDPRPEAIRDLHENLTLNGFQDRCTTVELALTSSRLRDYSLWMTRPNDLFPGKSERSTILPGYFGGDSLPVTTSTIDHVMKQYRIPHLEWIKMDVEGAELQVIEGGAQTIRKFKPNMLIECHNDHVKGKDIETKVTQMVFSIVPDYHYSRDTDLFGWIGSGNPHVFFFI